MANNDPHGDIKTALQHAGRLLQQQPLLAEQQAQEILKIKPDLDPALHILAAAYRFQGKIDDALDIMVPLAARHEKSAPILLELGLCFMANGQTRGAIKMIRKAVNLVPEHSEAWRILALLHHQLKDDKNAEKATQKYLDILKKNPEIIRASELFESGKLAEAEELTRSIVKMQQTDVVAARLLAEIALKIGRLGDAKELLAHCIELAPAYHHARHNYAVALYRKQELEEAFEQIDMLIKLDPQNQNYAVLKAAIFARKGDNDEALEIYEDVLARQPRQGKLQLSYGHTLKTVGRIDDAVRAYRKCIEVSPNIGETYWSLANLKTFRFSDDDLDNMLAQVIPKGGDPDDQGHLAFAIGKAYEDRKEFDKSFEFYQRGNDIRRKHHRHDARVNIYDTVRQIQFFNQEFIDSHEAQGCPAPDPIFVVGLPRAGSTLIEQILASHSQVEGTAELTDIIAISRKIGDRKNIRAVSKYPEILSDMSADDFKSMGESYIKSTKIQRSTLPYFIDKMPNNFQHIGLIHSILPNAKIIDARRHPMGGCFSGFKQLFANGQTFTYSLTDIGLYYRDYVKLMDHWDEVLPGRVHRVQYEEMVSDTETQIRALLDYCGLEFEEECLHFYETKRAIRTPSAEQVRQPIYTGGLEQWRNYEQHLGPLKEALGPLLERYPID
tara:strand:- start:36889 stop:38892 length:2004 start_codon:yes stop_codon:yes gene_type:complete